MLNGWQISAKSMGCNYAKSAVSLGPVSPGIIPRKDDDYDIKSDHSHD